jgi:diguanylate cyclase (GGDEF)-like protein
LVHRLEAQQGAEGFVAKAAQELRSAGSLEQFAQSSAALVSEVWPADHVLLLVRGETEGELEVVQHLVRGEPAAKPDDPEKPYRNSALPAPVKEALRRGFYMEMGLPFSRDPAFPAARSFLAVGLEHRGVPAGVLLATSTALQGGSAEGLRRARWLFSMAFSRSMYLREMEEAAIRDALTGVYTHNHFLHVLRHEVARANRYLRPAACLLIDVDGLRRINEGYGARFGDQVIREVAQLLKGLIRSSDTLARVSGGEFALLLPETPAEASMVVAERLRAGVAEHAFILQAGVLERLTVSVGIAIHPPHGVTALALMDAARQALRQAKSQGRSQVSLRAESLPTVSL